MGWPWWGQLGGPVGWMGALLGSSGPQLSSSSWHYALPRARSFLVMSEVPVEVPEAKVWNWLVWVCPHSTNQIMEEIGLLSTIMSNCPFQRKYDGPKSKTQSPLIWGCLPCDANHCSHKQTSGPCHFILWELGHGENAVISPATALGCEVQAVSFSGPGVLCLLLHTENTCTDKLGKMSDPLQFQT